MLRSLLNRICSMFGLPKKQPDEPAPVHQHAEAMRESATRRHELVGETHKLDARLHYLLMETQADAGWYGRENNSNPDC
jgi:gamma-glutamyltranspeptidase